MLTLDLLRFRVSGDSITPVYISSSKSGRYYSIAAAVVELYSSFTGKTVGELEERLEDALGSAPDYKVYRGLAKMMSDYVTVVPPTDMDCEALRMQVFNMAAENGPIVRKPDLMFSNSVGNEVARISGELGMTVEQLSAALYGDLHENQIIHDIDSTITPDQLIDRYNTALAQAMLYRATRMIIDVYDGYRTVFKYIKLSRLMHSVRSYNGGYRIDIDGPLSLFSNVERYGISMAKFLPAILKCENWRLAAKVNVGDGEKLFRLSPKLGLKSHYRDEPVFDSAPEEAFFTKFTRNKRSKWTIEREGSILDLKDTVLIPDFKFTHADGRVAHLEIVGFWTPEYLKKKISKLSRISEKNVIVAVPESRNCSVDTFEGRVIFYKSRLLIKDVLPALEEIAE